MKNLGVITTRVVSMSVILVITVCALLASSRLSTANTGSSTITVTNNSSRNIIHVYLAPPETDNWGADQLNDTILSSGQSFTITNLSCGDGGTKVIAEDTDGCFVSAVVSCSGNSAWSITNDATPNCGN